MKLSRRFALGGLPLLAGLPWGAGSALARIGPPGDAISDDQRLFAQVIDDYWKRSMRETNGLRREDLMRERGQALRAVLRGQTGFKDWICGVSSIAKYSTGRIYAHLHMGGTKSGALATMTNFGLVDLAATEIVEPHPLIETLRGLSDREAVLASGDFFFDEVRGYADGFPVTAAINASQAAFEFPSFIVRWSDLRQPAWLDDLSARSPSR